MFSINMIIIISYFKEGKNLSHLSQLIHIIYPHFFENLTLIFTATGGGSGKPTAVSVDPCDVAPCVLAKGKNSTITIHFTPGKIF